MTGDRGGSGFTARLRAAWRSATYEPPPRRSGSRAVTVLDRALSRRRILWFCGVAACVSILILAGTHLGPGLRAAHRDGTRGVWIAQDCTQQRGGCVWTGEFALAAADGVPGRVILPSVTYAGGLTGISPGLTVPALDAGSSDEVYPVSGSDRWIHDVIGLAVAGPLLAYLLWRPLRRRLRNRRAGISLAGLR